FLGILILQLDLKEITIGNHYPKRGVFTFLFKRLETGITIDGNRLAVTFAGFAVVVPRGGGGGDVIRICHRIENTDRSGGSFVAFALAVIAMHICDSESTDIFRRAIRRISSPSWRRVR